MRVAYADPPYLGKCSMYGHEHGEGGCWDDEMTHAALIQRLCREFPDGWALSTTSQSLRMMLDHCPDDGIRIGAWVKPFAAFRPNVTPAYAWEPVIFTGGRRRTREQWSGRDWVSAMPPVFSGERKGLAGMKPEAFCYWLFVDLFGLQPDDEFVDLFHGSGIVKRSWEAFKRQGVLVEAGETRE